MSGSLLIVGGDRAPHGLDAVAALVVLDGYLSHRTFGTLLAASRATGTPFAYAGRGGKAAVAAAGEALAAYLGARSVA